MKPTPALPGDYFAVFELEPKLGIDTEVLQQRFYELSRQHHPDRFASKTGAEQQYALDYTALLNDAYRVLRDAVARSEYMLKKEGFDIGEQRSNDVPPELLEEVFELNMMLEAAPDRPELEAARDRFVGMRAETDEEIAALFVDYDTAASREILTRLRGVLNRRRYIQNLLRDVEKALA
jgi:molecular chaperone HscB